MGIQSETNKVYNTGIRDDGQPYDRRRNDRRKAERRLLERRIENKSDEYCGLQERRIAKIDRRITIFNRQNIEVTDRRFVV